LLHSILYSISKTFTRLSRFQWIRLTDLSYQLKSKRLIKPSLKRPSKRSIEPHSISSQPDGTIKKKKHARTRTDALYLLFESPRERGSVTRVTRVTRFQRQMPRVDTLATDETRASTAAVKIQLPSPPPRPRQKEKKEKKKRERGKKKNRRKEQTVARQASPASGTTARVKTDSPLERKVAHPVAHPLYLLTSCVR